MSAPSVQDAFTALAQRLAPGATLLRWRALEGGVSALVHALELRDAGGEARRVVVRRHPDPSRFELAAREHALLVALRRVGLPVPAPRLLDDSRELLPEPFFVMDFVAGSPEVSRDMLPAALEAMARFLAELHSRPLATLELPALPAREDPVAGALEHLPPDADAELRAALGRRAPWSSRNAAALCHGDYWPQNILWRGGAIAAVLDWEDAAIGDPLSDLAACRLELLHAYDDAAAERFSARYLAALGQTGARLDITDLTIWELFVSSAALAHMDSWGLERARLERMRATTTRFMARAGRRLLARERAP